MAVVLALEFAAALGFFTVGFLSLDIPALVLVGSWLPFFALLFVFRKRSVDWRLGTRWHLGVTGVFAFSTLAAVFVAGPSFATDGSDELAWNLTMLALAGIWLVTLLVARSQRHRKDTRVLWLQPLLSVGLLLVGALLPGSTEIRVRAHEDEMLAIVAEAISNPEEYQVHQGLFVFASQDQDGEVDSVHWYIGTNGTPSDYQEVLLYDRFDRYDGSGIADWLEIPFDYRCGPRFYDHWRMCGLR